MRSCHSAAAFVMPALLLTPLAAQGTGTIAGQAHLGPERGLANVIVWISAGLPTGAKYQAPRAPVSILYSRGRFTPRVVALQAGQPLVVRNTDTTALRLRGALPGGEGFALPVRAASNARRYFAAADAPWRVAAEGDSGAVLWVAALRHPFFAISGPDGRFTITRVPVGTYTVTAWEEGRGTRTVKVTVRANGTATRDVDYGAR